MLGPNVLLKARLYTCIARSPAAAALEEVATAATRWPPSSTSRTRFDSVSPSRCFCWRIFSALVLFLTANTPLALRWRCRRRGRSFCCRARRPPCSEDRHEDASCEHRRRDGAKNAIFFECFPYVCPEPALAKSSFQCINGSQMPFLAG